MRILKALSMVCISVAAQTPQAWAQSYASSCLQACRIVSDPFPNDAVQPVACKLFERDALTQNTPVVAAGGSVACSFAVTLAPGAYSFTASALAAHGGESARSAALEFVLDASGMITLQSAVVAPQSGMPRTQFSPAPSR